MIHFCGHRPPQSGWVVVLVGDADQAGCGCIFGPQQTEVEHKMQLPTLVMLSWQCWPPSLCPNKHPQANPGFSFQPSESHSSEANMREITAPHNFPRSITQPRESSSKSDPKNNAQSGRPGRCPVPGGLGSVSSPSRRGRSAFAQFGLGRNRGVREPICGACCQGMLAL